VNFSRQTGAQTILPGRTFSTIPRCRLCALHLPAPFNGRQPTPTPALRHSEVTPTPVPTRRLQRLFSSLRWANVPGQRRSTMVCRLDFVGVRLFRLLIQSPEHRTQRCIKTDAMRQRSRTTFQSLTTRARHALLCEIYFNGPGSVCFDVSIEGKLFSRILISGP